MNSNLARVAGIETHHQQDHVALRLIQPPPQPQTTSYPSTREGESLAAVIFIMPGIHQQVQEGTPQLISNLEVLELLRNQPPPPRRGRRRVLPPSVHVAKHVRKYLETTPCVRIDSSKSHELLQKLQSQKKRAILPPAPTITNSGSGEASPSSEATGFGLTLAEAIQCLNMVPTEPVEIHLLVEDLPGRLAERQQQELLDLISLYDEKMPTPFQQGDTNNSPAQKGDETATGRQTDNVVQTQRKSEENGKEDSKPAAVRSVKEEWL